MNFLSYLTHPYTWILSFFRFISFKRRLEYTPMMITDNNNDEYIGDFTLILPKPIVILHDYIDRVIENNNNREIILKKLPDYGLVSVYMTQTMNENEINQHLISIHIYREENDNIIRLKYLDTNYEWHRDKNFLYGPNKKILGHFKNKPIFRKDIQYD